MYSLFEIINMDTGERLHLFNHFGKAALLRDILVQGRCKTKAEVRQLYVSEYWECEGRVFDDVADLVNAFRDPHKPVTHHMMVKHAESNVSFIPSLHTGAVLPAPSFGKDSRPRTEAPVMIDVPPVNDPEAPTSSPAAPVSESSPACPDGPESVPAPSASSVSEKAEPAQPAQTSSALTASAAAVHDRPAHETSIPPVPAAAKCVPPVPEMPARPKRARTGKLPSRSVTEHVPVYGSLPFRPCPKNRKRDKPLLDIVLLT